jgi:hypothetical protein
MPTPPKSRKPLRSKIICGTSTLRLKLKAVQLFSVAGLSLAALAVNSQTLPTEIRGYKVHRAKIEVRSATSPSSAATTDARVKLGKPHLVEASLTGFTFEVPVQTGPVPTAGTVNFLTFCDFRVNGIPVEIEEYEGPIQLKKGDPFTLPKPARIFVSSGGVLEAAWSEFKNSKKDWVVTGQVFVFGKFKKMGLGFKRVVPIDVDASIKNPFVSAQ